MSEKPSSVKLVHMDLLAQLYDDRDNAAARIAELEAALDDYARHKVACACIGSGKSTWEHDYDFKMPLTTVCPLDCKGCTCGLAKARRG